MKRVSLSGRFIKDIASDWNELKFQDVVYLCSLISSKIPVAEFKINFFCHLMGLKVLNIPEVKSGDETFFWFTIEKEKVLISSSHLNWASDAVLTLFKSDGDNGHYAFSTLTRNIFPVLKAGKLSLIGPHDGLTNITFKELMHCERLYHDYTTNHDWADVDKLIAVLFRQRQKGLDESSPEYKGDLRTPFNDYLIDHFSQYTSLLKPEVKQAILFFYEGCKRQIITLFPNVYSGGSATAKKIDIASDMISIANFLSNNNPKLTEENMNELAYMVLKSYDNYLLSKKPQE
jgi:hypothetical protein